MEMLIELLKLATALVALAGAIVTFRSKANGSNDQEDGEKGR